MASRTDTPTTAELVKFLNQGAEPWSYFRLPSHWSQLLSLHVHHR